MDCITVLEDVFYNSDAFTTLCHTHDIELDVTAEHIVAGTWQLEVEVTGINTPIFVQLFEALFN